MKLLLPLAVSLGLASACGAATIVNPQVYVGIADGGLVATVEASDYINYEHIGYWSSMSGGEMIVSVAPGQSVISATIRAAWAFSWEELENAEYTKVWELSFAGSFPEEGLDAGDQLWIETEFAGGQPTWWQVTQPMGDLVYVRFIYEAVTTEGVVIDDNGGTGYFGFVPEPSSSLLGALGMIAILRRRR